MTVHSSSGAHRDRNLTWLAEVPWASRLLTEATTPLQWVDEVESLRVGGSLREAYAGRMSHGFIWSEALWNACAKELEKVKLVAYGPSYHKRFVGDSPSAFFFHADRPDEIVFAPGLAVPPVLWVPLAPNAEQLHQLLHVHFPGIGAPLGVEPNTLRAFMGRPEALAVTDPAALERVASPAVLDRHWLVSPLADEASWGNGFEVDPFPLRIEPSVDPGYMWAETQAAQKHTSGVIARLSRRTLFSGSELAIEMHEFGDYIWHLRFLENPYPQVIERLNQYLTTPLPTSLPIDLAGAVTGSAFLTADELARRLELGPPVESIIPMLQGLAAVRHSDLSVTEILRRYVAHGQLAVRIAVVNLATSYNWGFLLEDACIRGEEDEGLRSHIEQLLDGVIRPPEHSETGVPLLFSLRVQENDEPTFEDEGDRSEEP